MKEKYVTYKKVKEYIKILELKINNSNWKPDLILSINRGGCVPGVFLSHKIGVSHKVINYTKNFKSYNKSFYKNFIVNHSSILIIDDINDSGNTLLKISKIFNEHTLKLKFAVLINNSSSSFEVDYYGGEINKEIDNSWIVFPWENIDAE